MRFSADGARLLVTTYPYLGLSVIDMRSRRSVADLGYEQAAERPMQAWFSPDGERVVTSADLRTVPLNSTRVGAKSEKIGQVLCCWLSDGDYAWAVVDHHLVVRKIPDEELVLRVKVRER